MEQLRLRYRTAVGDVYVILGDSRHEKHLSVHSRNIGEKPTAARHDVPCGEIRAHRGRCGVAHVLKPFGVGARSDRGEDVCRLHAEASERGTAVPRDRGAASAPSRMERAHGGGAVGAQSAEQDRRTVGGTDHERDAGHVGVESVAFLGILRDDPAPAHTVSGVAYERRVYLMCAYGILGAHADTSGEDRNIFVNLLRRVPVAGRHVHRARRTVGADSAEPCGKGVTDAGQLKNGACENAVM